MRMSMVVMPTLRQLRPQTLSSLSYCISPLRLFSFSSNLIHSNSTYLKESSIKQVNNFIVSTYGSASNGYKTINISSRSGSSLVEYISNVHTYNALPLTQSNRYRFVNYRNFSTLKRLQFKRNFIPRQSNNGLFPQIKYYRINPFVLIIGSFLSITMFFLVLPIILNLMLPLIILAIIIYQFNKWKRSQFYQQVIRILPRSDIIVPYRTINSLQYSFIPERLLMIKDLMKELSMFRNFDNSNNTKKEAIQFVQFVETRIMEALATDEYGIRSYILSNNNKFRSFQNLRRSPSSTFQLKLDTFAMKTYGERVGSNTADIMLSIQYPLKLIIEENQQIYLGTVTLTILDDSSSKTGNNSFKLFTDLAKTDAKCRLVISIVPVTTWFSLIPRQFVISTWGDSGQNFRKFYVNKTRGGHVEYTIR